MVHPVIQLLASRPDLLADHAAGYGALIAAQAGAAARRLRSRAILSVVAGIAAFGGLALSGTALLLFGAIPVAEMPRPWLLWAVPGVVWLVALFCWLGTRNQSPGWSFDLLREQVQADAALLRESARR